MTGAAAIIFRVGSDGDQAITPDDRDPPPEENPPPGLDAAWNDILRALQPLTENGEQKISDRQERHPDPNAPIDSAAKPVGEGETLDALQDLLYRHGRAENAGSVAEYADRVADDEWAGPGHFSGPATPAWRSNRTLMISILAGAVVLAALLAAILASSMQLFHPSGTQADQAPASRPNSASSSSAAASGEIAPVVTGATDRRGIEKAMADCDREALNHPDRLYFLVIPLISPAKNFKPVGAIENIGSAVSLLRSKDALDGLSDGRLALFSEPYRFTVGNLTTRIASSWPQASGVTRFVRPDATNETYTVSFGFAGLAGNVESNFLFERRPGECNWVSAFRRT